MAGGEGAASMPGITRETPSPRTSERHRKEVTTVLLAPPDGVWIEMRSNQEPHAYNRFREELQMAERIRTCGNPCCSSHRRQIGPERYYCADHWDAWEAIS